MVSTQTRSSARMRKAIWLLMATMPYFYKKDLSPQEIAAAEATLAGKKEEDKGQPLTDDVATYSRDASDEEKIQYISKTYGVPREAIKISNGFFVFNNPDQEYDPTHIHPYAVRKEHVRIPLETGNPELDFINELYATALRSGISPYSPPELKMVSLSSRMAITTTTSRYAQQD